MSFIVVRGAQPESLRPVLDREEGGRATFGMNRDLSTCGNHRCGVFGGFRLPSRKDNPSPRRRSSLETIRLCFDVALFQTRPELPVRPIDCSLSPLTTLRATFHTAELIPQCAPETYQR